MNADQIKLDPSLTVAAILAHDKERERIEDAIEIYARGFAAATGEPVSDDSYFEAWEIHAGYIHVKFAWSDQCGGGSETVRFPATSISNFANNQWAVRERIATIAAKREADRAKTITQNEAEIARLQERIAALSSDA